MYQNFKIKLKKIKEKSVEILLNEESNDESYLESIFQIELVEFVIGQSTININTDFPKLSKLKQAILCRKPKLYNYRILAHYNLG